MGRYIKTRIVTSGLIYVNDAGNTKSYSGVGTAVKNLVGYGATNTTFNQTFVSSGTTSYFVSTGSTSYISNTNVSVSASTGSGFTICMMIKPQTLTNSEWNYWFQQDSSITSVQFGRYGTSGGWEIKDNIKIEGQQVFTSVGTTTWTVPVGVTSITAVCVGGGGGAGGGSGTYEGAGGGGGGVAYGSTSVTPGDTLYIRVGAGGSGGRSYNYDNVFSAGGAGSSGQSSYIKTVSHSGTALLDGGAGGPGAYGVVGNASGGSGGSSSGTIRTNGGSGGVGGNGSSLRGGGGGGAGGYTGTGGGGGGGSSTANGSDGSGGGGGGGGNSVASVFSDSEVVNPGGGVGIYESGSNGPYGYGGYDTLSNAGSGGSGGLKGTSSSGNSTRSVGGLYGGGGGSRTSSSFYSYVRDGGNGGQGAVRIVWGSGRSYPSTNTSNPIPSTQSTSFSDWTFVVCGVTTNYYTFISTNGSTKTLGSSNDWNNSEQINLDKIFGTGTNNYSCLWNNVMIYNRELTNEEIQINFETYRRKFNL
jgi:hypothetical protein